jgi:hypothetical protein
LFFFAPCAPTTYHTSEPIRPLPGLKKNAPVLSGIGASGQFMKGTYFWP